MLFTLFTVDIKQRRIGEKGVNSNIFCSCSRCSHLLLKQRKIGEKGVNSNFLVAVHTFVKINKQIKKCCKIGKKRCEQQFLVAVHTLNYDIVSNFLYLYGKLTTLVTSPFILFLLAS